MKRGSKQPKAKGAGKASAPGVRSESVSMMGASVKPWMQKAKKPEADAKPKEPRPASTNKNSKSQNSARVKKLTGVLL